MYFAIDGDRVGSKIELYLLQNDEQGLASFSARLTAAIDSAARSLEERGCTIIFVGGDSILAKAPASVLDRVEVLPQMPGITFSRGIGNTCRDAYLALKYAKSHGRARTVAFCGGDFEIVGADAE